MTSDRKQNTLVSLLARLRSRLARLGGMVRASDWWDYKLAPLMAVFYGALLLQDASVASAWRSCLALLLAIAPGALYVSVINDLADQRDDLAAGKHNRLAGRPAWVGGLLVLAPVQIGLIFCFLWRDDLLLVLAYLGAWTAFSLYCLPPFRLKVRGGFGVIADASGAHLFPTLVAALLAFRAVGEGVDAVWVAAAGAWAFAAGLRGILWHQMHDVENDRRAGTPTFVVRRSPQLAARIARYVTFPVEVAALAVMLWRLGSVIPVAALSLYLIFAVVRSRAWSWSLIIAEPAQGPFSIIGYEFYSLLLPLGILVTSAVRFPVDWLVVAAHLLVFKSTALVVARQGGLLARGLPPPGAEGGAVAESATNGEPEAVQGGASSDNQTREEEGLRGGGADEGAREPVRWRPERHAWAVSGFEEVTAALRQPDVFSSDAAADFDPVLVGAEPEPHARVRGLLAPNFRLVQDPEFAAAITRVVDTLLDDGARSPEPFDLVRQFALPVGERVAGRFMGLEDDQTAEIVALQNKDPWILDYTGGLPEAFARQQWRTTRADAPPGLLCRLLRGDEGGLSRSEGLAVLSLMWVAGTTTSAMLVAATAAALLYDPALRETVREHPETIPGLLEEVLRLHPPGATIPRVTRSETTLGGVVIPAGAMVELDLASANRDPARYPDPDALRLDRPKRPHLTFGNGIHQCLGAGMARLTARIALERLMARFPHAAPVLPLGELHYERPGHINALTALPCLLGADAGREAGLKAAPAP